jgi:hypothetical protein
MKLLPMRGLLRGDDLMVRRRMTAKHLAVIRALFPANRGRADMPIMPLGDCLRVGRRGGVCTKPLDHPGRCDP